MKNLTIIELSLILAVIVIFAGCVAPSDKEVSQIENVSVVSNISEEPVETLPEKIVQPLAPNETGREQPLTQQKVAEEWCVPTKINFIAEPYVSVHSPKVVHLEYTIPISTAALRVISYGNGYYAPLTGKITAVTSLGIPQAKKVTEIELQSRMIKPDGTVVYGDSFELKDVPIKYDERTTYEIYKEYNVEEEGKVIFDSRLNYKIGGVSHTQCTAKNEITVLNKGSYQVPTISSPVVGELNDFVTVANINSKFNITFSYTGIKPSSASGYLFSSKRPDLFEEFGTTALECGQTSCTATMTFWKDENFKERHCKEDKTYIVLAVKYSDAAYNFLINTTASKFLANFGGCPSK